MIKHLKGMPDEEFFKLLYDSFEGTGRAKAALTAKVKKAFEQKDIKAMELAIHFVGLVQMNKQWFIDHRIDIHNNIDNDI